MSEELKPIIEETSSVEKRLWLFTLGTLVVEIIVSLIFSTWFFTLGVIVGGSLAIINFRLLQTSVRGMFQSSSNSFAIKFFLRYAIIGLVVLMFYLMKEIPIIGILLGISSFVAALMLEAGVQFYFVITGNEEV